MRLRTRERLLRNPANQLALGRTSACLDRHGGLFHTGFGGPQRALPGTFAALEQVSLAGESSYVDGTALGFAVASASSMPAVTPVV